MTRDIQELKRVERADVYCSGVLAGYLTRRRDGGIEFSYALEYLASGLKPIATTLPFSSDAIVNGGGALPAFFSGLLPEGHRLTVLKNAAKTSLSDELTLLLAVGSDTPGNVSVVPDGEPLRDVPAAVLLEQQEDLDFEALVKTLDRHSIPGVQDKISATMLTTPVSTSSGAYLLKADPRDHPHLVVNEAAHLAAAKTMRLPVANNELLYDSKGVAGLLVERFDRRVSKDGTSRVRLAQEDAMQVLNLPPANKYSVSAEQVVEALAAQCQAPVIAKRNLYMQFLFAWLTGNGDLHAKNASILADEQGRFAVAPIYDIPCTLLYGDETLALSVTDKIKNLKRKHWAEFAESLGLATRAVASANQLVLRAANSVDLSALPFEGSPLRGTQRELRFRRHEID